MANDSTTREPDAKDLPDHLEVLDEVYVLMKSAIMLDLDFTVIKLAGKEGYANWEFALIETEDSSDEEK